MVGLKNISIIILIAIAIFQTAKLWFESTSNRNFFYPFFVQSSKPTNIEEKSLLTPSMCIINFGNKTFKPLFSTDSNFVAINNEIENIIKQTLMESNNVFSTDIDWNDLLTSKSIIYQYNYMLKTDTLAKSLKTRISSAVNKTDDFDTIIITPMKNNADSTKVVFMNSDKQLINQYEISNSNKNVNIYELIERLQQDISDPIYISTKQARFDLFTKNLFIPQFASDSQVCVELYSNNLIQYPVDLQTIERLVDPFFDNPTSKWSILDMNGIYMFSDQTVVVKYYEAGIIEYSNYSNVIEKTVTDLSASFISAQEILLKDRTLNNNISLSNIIETDDGFIFLYDYIVNNIPIAISENLSNQINMGHAIEITTTNNTVKRYKRYVKDFKADKYEKVNIDFLTALNNVLAKAENVEEIQNIMLIYNLDNDKKAVLNWLIEIDDIIYTQPAAE